MAITIRNKTTEGLIRKIGRRTGEGPSAIILRLVQAEALGDGAQIVPADEARSRIQQFEALANKFPPPEPKPSWDEIRRETEALYDDPDTEGSRQRT